MQSVLVSIGVTAGRAGALVALAVALIGVIIGGLALARATRGRALAALVVASIGVLLGARHLANATGGIGSGSGRLGAIVALTVGVFGLVLGGLALARSRRIG